MIKVSPSMLACDFSKFGEEAVRMKNSGADWLHLDVMDGHFVPNISFGAGVISSIRNKTDLVFDVHLMISDPLKYAQDFAKAGADLITFHLESDSPVDETIEKIHSLGCKCGISIKPGTPAEKVFPYLDKIEMVLVMTVEPGFGGQKFMADMMPKITAIREKSPNILIQVDGGINAETAKVAVNAGADVLVAGSAVFNSDEPEKIISALKGE